MLVESRLASYLIFTKMWQGLSITYGHQFLPHLPFFRVASCFKRNCEKVKVLFPQLCPTLCNPKDYSLAGFSVHGISQARRLEWVAIPFSRGFSQPRDQTRVSCITGRFFTTEPPRKPSRETVPLYNVRK